MNVFLEILRFFVGFSFQLSFSALIICLSCWKRKLYWLRLIPSFLVINLYIFLFPEGYNTPYLRVGSWFSFSYMITFLMVIGMIYLCYQVRLLDAFVLASAAYAVQNILFNIFTEFRSGTVWALLVALLVDALLYALLYFVLVRRHPLSEPSKKIDKNDILKVAISLVTVSLVYVFNLWMRKNGYQNIVTKIYSILCCLFLLMILFGIFNKSKLEEEKDITEKLLQMSQKQYKTSNENQTMMNIKIHDLKHQIHRLRDVKTEEEQKRYLDEAEESILLYDAYVKTGSSALDTNLTEKSIACERKKIRLTVIVDGKALDFMDAPDIYSLFGNALDNAIESVSQEEEDKRIIAINVSRRNDLVFIHIDNFCGREVRFENGLPLTSKENKSMHGYGTKSIKYIVDKYRGNLRMSLEDGRFNVDILLPCQAKKASASTEKLSA